MCTPLVFQYDYSPVKPKWICTIVQHAVRRRCSICQCPLQAQMGGNHHPQMGRFIILTVTLLGIMVKGNHPPMALIQVSELSLL